MESAQGELDPSPEEVECEEVRIPREMMLRARREGEEHQVPVEKLQANDLLQQDELLTLEAIYGEKIGIFGEIAGLRCFQSSRSMCIVQFQVVSVYLQNYFKVLMMPQTV